jgi:4-amino-4-deoxy-L-arabinose transferase-like glycosyltransferase
MGAGIAILAVPALFAHGHLAHTDLFLTAFWFGSVASLDVAIERGRSGWFLASGLLLGAAMATKFSGLLVLPVLALWLLAHRHGIVAMIVLLLAAGIVFVAVNPVMWVDPVQGARDYLQAGLNRSIADETRIVTEYFGVLYPFRPPWHYPYVWTAIVLPLPLLAAIAIGLVARRSGALRALVLINMTVLYGALALPSAPMHDGIRLLLPLFPLYCVLAGTGIVAVGEWGHALVAPRLPAVEKRRDLVVALVMVALLAVPLFRTAQYHPHQLSYFNALVGGVEGAEERGLEVTNLKEVLSRDVLEDLAELMPGETAIDPGFFLEEICFYRAVEWAPEGWRTESQLVKRDGTAGLVLACEGTRSFTTVALDRAAAEPDYVFVLNRKAQWRPLESVLAERAEPPVYEIALRGVPLMRVYGIR